MPKSAAFREGFLDWAFLDEDDPLDGVTEFRVGLHSDDPGLAGDQETNEISYTGYVRPALARGGSPAAFVRTDNEIALAENLEFPDPSSGTGTATHASIGTDATGPGTILWSGAIDPPIDFAPGSPPVLTTQSIVRET